MGQGNMFKINKTEKLKSEGSSHIAVPKWWEMPCVMQN